ncbi:MAG: tetratricopeptide repeat protein [Desulfobacteraceae bacterium]|nr:MAG: tetratricopeptide repeat protein [Desulfobacteraceae bacterium]
MKRLIFVISLVTGLTLVMGSLNKSFAGNFMDEADVLYAQRGTGFNTETLLADNNNIDKAIVLYKKVVETTSGSQKQEAIWKLIRAYHFKGYYATSDSETKKKIYDLGKDIGPVGLKEFSESVGIHLWVAIIWGVWGEEYGIFQAARQGVAKKMRYHCEKVIELDEYFDEAAGYRIFGRLHYKAPKIPFILGWPSNDEAIKLFEKAYRIAPQNLFTKQYLAEALYKKGQKERAIGLMKQILKADRIVEGVAEDAVIKNKVAATLKKWQKTGQEMHDR